MARIRTIKPEFPHSESMGKVSRDARLLFIELWTISDDSGRLRGNSRMLASLLFPYDNDAPNLIESWLGELVREECIIRYVHDKQNYVQICNWLSHQKIDKPTDSKLPSLEESSRILSNPLEVSSEDQDQGSRKGKEYAGSAKANPVGDVDMSLLVDQDRPLKVSIEAAFCSKLPGNRFTSYPKERENIKRIVTLAKSHRPDDTEGFAKTVIAKFWELRQTDRFIGKQPFTPSCLLAQWDRVLMALGNSTSDNQKLKQVLDDLGVV